jgi:hypothetical protein
MLTRLALATIAAVVLIVAPAQAQHPQTARFVYTDTHVALASSTANDVTVALGATVRFEYPEGSETHNVNLERPGPYCGQLAGLGTGNRSRILPNPAEGPGWVVECRFDTPGVYHFGSDGNGTLNGIIRVANADGSVPADNPPPAQTPQETFVPGAPEPPPSRTGSAPAGKKAATWWLARNQRGTSVRITLRGGSERGRIIVEALAKRTDLRAKGKARLVRVGRVTKTVGAGARATLTVRLNAKARTALRRLGRLKLTLRVTAAGRTTSHSVTLRRSA